MSDMSTLAHSGARLVATDTPHKDAEGANGTPASQGRTGGKTLPPDAVGAVGKRVQKHQESQEQRVQRAVTRLNDYVQSFQRDLVFSVDSELGRPVVRVIDSSTHEVIRQIPNEVALRLARNLNALQDQTLSKLFGSGGSASGRFSLINTKT
jgi:flagellar protein FlaG